MEKTRMKTGIIIQARMSSKRLRGKSMRLLSGTPLIGHVIARCKRVGSVDAVILATSSDTTDDPLASFAKEQGVAIYRGELENVQNRFFMAAREYGLDLIIRVTGDNPLISPELMDMLIEGRARTDADYAGFSRCTYGTGAEIFTGESFMRVLSVSATAYDREHVTVPYYQKKELFKTVFFHAPDELYSERLRLTVDTYEDLVSMEKVYNTYAQDNYVLLRDVIRGEDDAQKNC
jgi:spore coat polysaccharide biosynthesis protein SpsF (cytidylyltransferase family)